MGSPPAPPLLLLLLPVLLSSAALPDSGDVACLTNFHSSLQDPTNSLANWNQSNLASPCGGGTSSDDSRLRGTTCSNGRIFKISLPGLSLSGSLSPFLSNCSNLQSLDLSSNLLSGEIPPELRLLSNLAVLNLSGNALSGPIPPGLAACTYLNVIDLHGNRLSGPIPPSLASLSRLSSFDVSDNRLSGPIPPGLANRSSSLPRFNASSFQGNKGLYGYPLAPFRPDRGLSLVAIVGIGLGSGLLSLVISFAAVCVWLRLSERKLAAEEAKISHLMPDY